MLTLKRVFSNNESKGYPILEFLITASIIALAFSLILSQITLAKNNIPKSVETNIKLDLKQSMPIISKNEKYEVKLSASDYEVKLASQKATAKKKERIEILARSNEGRAEGISFDQKRALVKTTAQKFGIDWKILEAVWQVESGKSWDTSKNLTLERKDQCSLCPEPSALMLRTAMGTAKRRLTTLVTPWHLPLKCYHKMGLPQAIPTARFLTTTIQWLMLIK